MIDYVTLLGMIAGVLTTICFVPQIVKVFRTKSTRDISLWTYVIMSIGFSMWLVYGLWINSTPVVIFNIVGVIFAATIAVSKLIYK